jgi:PTS system ascorbate-specific IIB component
MKILTVCGNGIGSSLMLAMKVDEICKENNIKADVESTDFDSAKGKKADLLITIKELAVQLEGRNVAIVRSYTNKEKIIEDVLDKIKETYEKVK